jgi:hypothetical protein
MEVGEVEFSAMSNKWKYFLGASILAVGLLLKAGAPLFPVVLGLAAAAFLTWKKTSRPTNHLPR